jgi:hypothetical protein
LERSNGNSSVSVIYGVAGIGKSALAIHVGHLVSARYPDAQIVVNMAGSSINPAIFATVITEVIQALEPDYQPQNPDEDDLDFIVGQYHRILLDKRALIIFEDAEDAAQVARLIPATNCAAIVTSRNNLRIPSAHTLELGPLNAAEARILLSGVSEHRRIIDRELEFVEQRFGFSPLLVRLYGSYSRWNPDWSAEQLIQTLSSEEISSAVDQEERQREYNQGHEDGPPRSDVDGLSPPKDNIQNYINKPPICFVNYSWDSDEHKTWVRELAEQLQNNGVRTLLDQWDAYPGIDLLNYMESGIMDSNYVLLICTPTYASKANSRDGGVGLDYRVITSQHFIASVPDGKFVPVLREGSEVEAMPTYMLGKMYLDFRIDTEFEEACESLLQHIFDLPRWTRPKLGTPSPF